MKCSDWIVDLGPGGGKNGGKLSYEGTPEMMKKAINSVTSKYVLNKLNT